VFILLCFKKTTDKYLNIVQHDFPIAKYNLLKFLAIIVYGESTYFLVNKFGNGIGKKISSKFSSLTHTHTHTHTHITSTLDLELRKKLVKCYIWSIAFYGDETWTLRTVFVVDHEHSTAVATIRK